MVIYNYRKGKHNDTDLDSYLDQEVYVTARRPLPSRVHVTLAPTF